MKPAVTLNPEDFGLELIGGAIRSVVLKDSAMQKLRLAGYLTTTHVQVQGTEGGSLVVTEILAN